MMVQRNKKGDHDDAAARSGSPFETDPAGSSGSHGIRMEADAGKQFPPAEPALSHITHPDIADVRMA
jgi:hypothetical protein